MSPLFNVLETELLLSLFLVFVRVTSLMLTAPYFSGSMMPTRVKILLGLAISVIMFPSVPADTAVIPVDAEALELLLAIIKEVAVGVVMGLVGKIIFAGIQFGGQMISLSSSLSFANLVDPVSRSSQPLVAQFLTMVGLLFFLMVGGDRLYIRAMAFSFEVVPVGDVAIAATAPELLHMAAELFWIGIQLAAPFVMVLFLLDLCFAIFARIVPQANIFFIALPVKVGIAFLLLLWSVPYWPPFFDQVFSQIWDGVDLILRVMGG